MSRPDFILTLISNEPEWIRAGDEAGVGRIGLDIEHIPDSDQARHISNVRASGHRLADMSEVTAMLTSARPFIRINRMHHGTRDEIDQAVRAGAKTIMLPGFTRRDEVEQFIEWIGGRAEPILLLETAAGVARLHDWLGVDGVCEVFVGMNDLHVELRLSSAMELLCSDLMRYLSGEIRGAGVRFGCGGVARMNDSSLPIPPDLVLARYVQLGAQAAWIARSFFKDDFAPGDFSAALLQVQERLDYWFQQSPADLETARCRLVDVVQGWKR